jgi:hypothetical protein
MLTFTLRDLRRLATDPTPDTSNAWEGRMYGRLSVLPDQAQPLERSALMAAVSVGTQIIQLRRICRRFDLSLGLDAALEAVAGGNCAMAAAELANLETALTSGSGAAVLRARGVILAISDALTQYAFYFDAGEPWCASPKPTCLASMSRQFR